MLNSTVDEDYNERAVSKHTHKTAIKRANTVRTSTCGVYLISARLYQTESGL